jgi:5'-nucleotidase
MKRLLLVCCLLAACVTPQPAQVAAAAAPATAPIDSALHLTIVATNDQHGWVMPQVEKFGTAEIRGGGSAVMASYVKAIRAANPGGVLLFDAGDLFQGTLVANLSEGAVVIDAMNAIGYDGAAVGNHEFDYGPIGSVSVATQANVDPFGALKARIAQAKFPLLSTNIYESSTGRRPGWLPGDGLLMIERKGIKIGVFGLTTPQTPVTTVPVNVASLRFGSLAPEALTASKQLREKGADVVIALVHAGGKCAKWDQPDDTSSCDEKTGEIFDMMRGLPPGTIDAVVAGHTHAVMAHRINGTPVIETYGLGRFFSTIDLYLDPATHKLISNRTVLTPLIPLCETVDASTGSCDPRVLRGKTDVAAVPATFHDAKIVADTEVATLIEPALAKVRSQQEQKLGLKVPKTLGRDYENESVLGSFLADSLRGVEKADVALLNPGGLRADLKAGEVTYGSVYEVLPFDNAISTLTLSAEELTRLLRAAYGSRKGVFQLSGIEVMLSRCPTSDRLKQVTVAGKPLDANKKFRVVMPDFLARGGDGLAPILSTIEPEQVDLGENRELNLRDALVEFWKKKKEPFESPKAGRVSFLADGDKCSPGTKLDGQTGIP